MEPNWNIKQKKINPKVEPNQFHYQAVVGQLHSKRTSELSNGCCYELINKSFYNLN